METTERSKLLSDLAEIRPEGFEALALRVFRYQARNNPLYARFLQLLGRHPERIDRITDIPFLPIGFFKTHNVQTGAWTPATVFTSSGTSGQTPSRHLVRDPGLYRQNTRRGFSTRYSDPRDWRILAVLPSYLERQGSSLVAMADDFIQLSKHPDSGFFLNDTKRLEAVLQARRPGEKTLLLGVSFALLDLAERNPMDLRDVVVMETGGMKGRREEITREALHRILEDRFQLPAVHSEYGMTELFSQAYSQGAGRFYPAPTLQVLTTEANDPFSFTGPGRNGVLCCIDLANVDTCSFIATEDVGKVFEDGSFEVMGRLDSAELRGCNLLLENVRS